MTGLSNVGSGQPPPSRLAGIEAARFVLCYAVILLHITNPPRLPWQWLTVAACNAAVPFFFITSGYFNRIDPTSNLDDIWRPARRLGGIYLAWLAIYHGYFAMADGAWPALHARDLIDGGRAYHLWFLPALAGASVLVGLGFRYDRPRLTVTVCAMLALLAMVPRVVEHAVPAFPGTRALAAPLYVVGGKLLARRSFAPHPLVAAAAAGAFWLLAFADPGFSVSLAGQPVLLHSAPLMTYGLGFAMFLLARALPNSRAVGSLATLGGVSLGIYSVHLLVLGLVMPGASAADPMLVFVRAALVLGVSTVAAAGIATLPFCWRLATHRRQRLSPFVGSRR